VIQSAIEHVQDPLGSVYVFARKANGLCFFRYIYIYMYIYIMVKIYCEREQEITSVEGIEGCVELVVFS
jgi:hypothetical protein